MRDGQADGDRGPCPERTRDLDATSVYVYQPSHDREAKSCTSRASRPGFVHAIETIEDVREVILRDPNTVVRHGEQRLRSRPLNADAHATVPLGEFDRIVDQVGERLRYRVRVTINCGVFPVHDELDTALRCRSFEAIRALLRDREEVD